MKRELGEAMILGAQKHSHADQILNKLCPRCKNTRFWGNRGVHKPKYDFKCTRCGYTEWCK